VTIVSALDYSWTENLLVGAAISVTHSGPGISLRSSLAEDGDGVSVSGDSFKVSFGPNPTSPVYRPILADLSASQLASP
jgi:hypothetical protein